jgi:hypothetical protein
MPYGYPRLTTGVNPVDLYNENNPESDDLYGTHRLAREKQKVAVRDLNEAMLVLYARCTRTSHFTQQERDVIKSLRNNLREHDTLTNICVMERTIGTHGYYREGMLEELYDVLIAKYIYVTALRHKAAADGESLSGLFNYAPLLWTCIGLCDKAIIAMGATGMNNQNPDPEQPYGVHSGDNPWHHSGLLSPRR